MKSTLGLLCLLAACPAIRAEACPGDAILQRITAMGSVYIGELHGTQESPVFVRCLVDSNDDFDHRVGDALRDLATKGRVIAYSGNFHNMKVAPPGVNMVPAGAYVGPAFTHIAIVDVNGGTAWFSTADGTGVHKLTPKHTGYGEPGTLIDGHENGYDFMYLVPTFTASLPSKPVAPAAPPHGGILP